MERLPLEWFFEVPILTRVWTSGIAFTALLEQCDVLSKPQLLYNFHKVFHQREYWRLVTTFFYFGPLSLNLLFSAYFVAKYSRMLEEESYRNHTKEYGWVLFLGAIGLLVVATFTGGSMPFLGPYLSNCLTYLWARRNPGVQLSFLGLFNFTAPYLPWVMAFFSVVLNGASRVKGQILGTLVGHFLFFAEDVYPRLNRGKRLISPPWDWFVDANQNNNQNSQPVPT